MRFSRCADIAARWRFASRWRRARALAKRLRRWTPPAKCPRARPVVLLLWDSSIPPWHFVDLQFCHRLLQRPHFAGGKSVAEFAIYAERVRTIAKCDVENRIARRERARPRDRRAFGLIENPLPSKGRRGRAAREPFRVMIAIDQTVRDQLAEFTASLEIVRRLQVVAIVDDRAFAGLGERAPIVVAD